MKQTTNAKKKNSIATQKAREKKHSQTATTKYITQATIASIASAHAITKSKHL